MDRAKAWVIVNLQDAGWICGHKLPQNCRPSFIHFEKELAEDELLRLQALHPNGDFYLFETVAFAQPSPVLRGMFFVEEMG